MTDIHPNAVVSPKAKLGENVKISAFAVIEDDVEIGDNCEIGSSAVIYSGTRLAGNIRIFQGASVGHEPQDLKYNKEKTYLYVGENTTVREFVTLNRGTEATGKTVIGSNVLFMAYSHTGHDVRVGDNVIIANSVQLGGHVEIDDYAIIGGGTVVHQFELIGSHAMVGGGRVVIKDVPPYVICTGEPVRFAGINSVGLKRRGFSSEERKDIKKMYGYIFGKQYNVSQAKEVIKKEFAGNKHAVNIVEFLEKSNRGIIGR